mmetsp:Transcript_9846/g.14827  ORF Transcript_9846/g.14827 Transcript_9846/m.14827 type:complete len:314 (-) Transcript_9846:349-1290(-)|eukprot:CAMPEP_0185027294 /NCGR_PEP_ID=MMETSP1103-20130426/12151_1 /TAXON_ID=36769 /ORGANISM="Paraphysomonas bandaiensis, Strain Caron Lab Isolate" /LENGTH=313 /DNA_ID=CAMNT_0027561221 /DNA_START=104 /DNA_END=1045 /DNA_ORIENTATION=+
MEDHHKIVVWGLPSSIDIDKLKDMLLVYGEPVRADITRRNTLVYAFVEFRKMQEAAKAVEALNGSRVDKQIISIKLARPRSSSCEPKKVFVYNLPASYTDDQICDLFAQFGEITAYSITWGGDFQSGFFEYKHAHECDAALNILHNSVLEGAHSIYVYYARSPQHTVFFTGASNQVGGVCLGSTPHQHANWSSSSPPASQPFAISFTDIPPGIHLPEGILDGSSSLRDVDIAVSGLPPYICAKSLFQLFDGFGSVVSVGIDVSLEDGGISSSGTGRLRMVVTASRLQDLVFDIHNRDLFDSNSPIQLSVRLSH